MGHHAKKRNQYRQAKGKPHVGERGSRPASHRPKSIDGGSRLKAMGLSRKEKHEAKEAVAAKHPT